MNASPFSIGLSGFFGSAGSDLRRGSIWQTASLRPAVASFVILLTLAPLTTMTLRAAEPAPDPKLVEQAKTALGPNAFSQTRQLALLEVNNPDMIRALARKATDIEIRYVATLLLKEESDLQQQALGPDALLREVAAAYVTDESFLLSRALGRDEKSPAVRRALVSALSTQAALAEAAQTAYFRDVREAAAKRVTDRTLVAKIRNAQTAIESATMAAAGGGAATDPVQQSLNATFDVVRVASAQSLLSQDQLASVVLKATDHAVLKVVFAKLTDPALLEKVANEAVDPTVRFAAAFRTGSQSFADILKAVDACTAASSMSAGYAANLAKALNTLSTATAAYSLFGEVQASATENLRTALRWRGNENHVVEMVELLELYGDIHVAQSFASSGQPDWEDAGYYWIKGQGYAVEPRLGTRPTP